MKSIGTRLTVWYALSATATLVCLFVGGYYLLQSRMIHGLDVLNAAEFEQIKARLGPDYANLDARVIDERIRETTEYASVLFYITVEDPRTGLLFSSSNLNGHPIPDVKGLRTFEVEVPDIGALRVAEFIHPPFDISVGTSLRPVGEVMRGYIQVCLALVVAMLLVSVAIGHGLSHVLLRPVRLISETARRIGSDNLSERIPVPAVQDEISDLARLLNQTFDRLESAFHQISRFSAQASHELKTPLSLIRLHAEKLLEDGALGPTSEEAVQVQLEELARLNQIIDELLFLSRAEAGAITINAKAQPPARFLENFRQDACVLAEHHGRRFHLIQEGDGQVVFEEKWIRQVLLNLLTNALHASPPGGRITLRSTLRGSTWRAAVEDDGPGIEPDQLDRIFEPFVRLGANNDAGSGLGLAICRSIVGLHRGKIFAEPGRGGRGLCVAFEIPVNEIELQSPVHVAGVTQPAARAPDEPVRYRSGSI
ncbi:sensor histidine kinase [Roseiterribacter gracilis]|uniref:histidine kinase n=1 Tax=Roseiterribacter gracilis TaxID=2812848 RepID=A0A8S8XHV3_9PROT|nr:two-component sensor histidine kinase [Rhodospirillales bacterium TMPK1]